MKIITYHYVREVGGSKWPALPARSLEEFEHQLRYFKRTGRVVSMAELMEKINRREKMDKNDILLTFDDGYRDHWQNVWPRLEREKMPGTFFISTQAVWERKLTETNKIQLILGTGTAPRQVLEEMRKLMASGRNEWRLQSYEEYWRRWAKASRFDGPSVRFIKNMLQFGLPSRVRSEMIDRMFRKFVNEDELTVADDLYMTVDQVRELRQAGMHIGSHGHRHRWLDQLPVAEQQWELEQAKKYIATLGRPGEGWTMCYPYGAYNQDTIKLLKAMKCAAAFTTRGGEISGRIGDNRYYINRLDTNDLVSQAAGQ